MISQKLEGIFNIAVKKVNDLRHEYLTMESLLLALINDAGVLDVLRHCGANLSEIEQDLHSFLGDESNFSVLSDHQVDELSKQQFNILLFSSLERKECLTKIR